MSWTVDVKSYRATAVQFQIQNLSKVVFAKDEKFKRKMAHSESALSSVSNDDLESFSSSGSRSPRACARVMDKSFVAKTGVEVSF